jgi:predicted membrane channel-forming protein YqfA (hemolysin III family)
MSHTAVQALSMNRFLVYLPTLLTLVVAAALLVHGPIPQWPDYHLFADRREFAGIPRAGDVLSNAAFALIGFWGLFALAARDRLRSFGAAAPAYTLFLVALILTALGSGFYHLAPDNARLVWDRIPIALACAGLLAGVRAETRTDGHAKRFTAVVGVAAVASVLWWYVTETHGQGDLRPYLFVQLMPAVLIPLWQALARAPRADRLAFGAAILLYFVARAAEFNDRALFDALGWISGHTIKHLVAACAAALIVARLVARASAPLSPAAPHPSAPRSSDTAPARGGAQS